MPKYDGRFGILPDLIVDIARTKYDDIARLRFDCIMEFDLSEDLAIHIVAATKQFYTDRGLPFPSGMHTLRDQSKASQCSAAIAAVVKEGGADA